MTLPPVYGLEAKHVWTSAGVGSPSVALNDLLAGSPRLKLTNIGGLRAGADIQDSRAPRTGQIGEVVYPTKVQGKTLSYEGMLQARSLSDLRALEDEIISAFSERDLEGRMDIVPRPEYGDATHYWQYWARVVQIEVGSDFISARQDGQIIWPYTVPFTLGLRMSDPRYYWSDVVVSPTVAATGTGADATASVTVTNLGGAPANPIITCGVTTGNEQEITLSNDTISAQLLFIQPDSGGTFSVDFKAREITQESGILAPEKLILGTAVTWWDPGVPGLQPGDNVIREVGCDNVQVTFQHARW